jgi:hypothetical protein
MLKSKRILRRKAWNGKAQIAIIDDKIRMRFSHGSEETWFTTQQDILAEDWEALDDPVEGAPLTLTEICNFWAQKK